MLISELEARLKELREKHGDLPVFVTDRLSSSFHEDLNPAYLHVCNNVQYHPNFKGDWVTIETWGLHISNSI